MADTVKVLYFGAAMEMAGKAEEDIAAGDTAELRREIFRRYPAIEGLTFRMALNRVLLSEEALLKQNDIVAILPPFEGG